MSRTDRRWARFYFDDFIRDYPEVYADDAAFATWMRLLVVAEKAWPAQPELPRSVRVKSLQKLRGLVAVGPNFTFSIKGFDAERSRRHANASAAAHAKWDAVADANAHADAMLVRERERDETNTPPPRVGRRKDGTNPRALGTNPRATGTSPRQTRDAEKRAGMPQSVHEILRKAAGQ